MHSVRIRKLSKGSWAKLFALVSGSVGIFVGIIAFLGSIIGLPVKTTLLFFELTGIQAGFVSLLLAPVLFSLFGALFALVAYFPALLVMKITGGIRIDGEID